MRTSLCIVAMLCTFISGRTAWAIELLSGPVVGHTTATSARIWVETNQPATVTVTYWQEPRTQYSGTLGEPMQLGSAEGRTAANAPHTGVIQLDNLQEGWLIYYELAINGTPVRPHSPQAFWLLPPETYRRGQEERIPDFSVAFTSCMFPARVPLNRIWEQVASYRPSALLLIGDNNYMPGLPGAYDTSEDVIRHTMHRYHRNLRDMPGLRTLLATTPIYSIWDDHDFGPNDSDGTFRWRDYSLEIWKQYYPNPYANLPETPGIFYSFRIGDAEFFMLDGRYYRDPKNAPDRKSMLGEGQVEWLKNSLTASTATFKIIACGSSMLVERRGSGESWSNFGTEREEFLQWMSGENITGVLFAAGDWHVGTLSRHFQSDTPYPLYELLASNAGVRNAPFPPDGQKHYRFHQFAATEIVSDNFGMIRFEGPKGKRTVTLQILDIDGKVRIELPLTEKDLTPDWNR
jgi:alkaline phosphatase D